MSQTLSSGIPHRPRPKSLSEPPGRLRSYWSHRVVSVVRVSLPSSFMFANRATAIVMVVFTPLLDVIFSVLLGLSLGSPDVRTTAYSGTLLAGAMAVAISITTAVSFEKDQGVIEEVLTRRSFDTAYWFGLSLCGFLTSLGTVAVPVIGVWLLDPAHSVAAFGRTVALLPIALLVGACLGIFAAQIGLLLFDAFAAINLITAFAPLTAGIVVPLHLYPEYLATVFHALPLSATISALQPTRAISTGLWLSTFGIELGIGLVELAVGLVLSRYAIAALRNGKLRVMNG